MTEVLHLLLLEDTKADVELCLAELERGGFDLRADVVGTREGFEAQIRANSYDVVVADYRLPHWTGMDALAALRKHRHEIPLILVTGTLGDELAVECLRQGVADYVVKENLARLPFVVRRVIDERSLRDQRSQAANALNATEARYQVLFESMPLPVWVFDLETHQILAVNAAALQHYGYSREEFLALRIEGLRPAEDIAPFQEHARRSSRGVGIQSSEAWRHRKKDGSLILVEVTWHTLTWNGRPAEIVAASDITERRRAEEALAESEALYRKVIEASFDGIGITEEGVVREVNRGFAEMFGYSIDEVIGRPILDFVADESAEAVRRVSDGVEGTYELVGKRKDGTKVLLEATARIHNIGGRPGRLTALRDVTEKRSLEEQFRQAQKMEAVGRLAGGVAHDFNNLLTVITSCTELLLQDTADDDPRQEDLEEIRKAAAGAAGLTRQLLVFSRQQVIEPRLVAMEDVVTTAEKMLQRLIGEDVELVTVLTDHPATVKIDPGQLEQIIMNLAVNARDAMPEGGKLTIESSVIELDEAYARSHWPATPGRFALLAVSDTGTGMTQQTRARIFEPFFTTKETGKGTGLGLATVYGIVKQNGGFIWVYSEVGQGTTFKIYLPWLSEAPDERKPVSPAASLQGAETILLTEDAPALRTTARKILERYGYTVVEAPHGKAALELALKRDGPIHLLLTDVVMPGMSGRELAERLAAKRPEIRVLYMSGYTDDAVVRHGVLQPGIAYLQKPFTPESLARKLREVLDSATLPARL